MKTLFTLFFSFLSLVATAQVPEPNMLWLKTYGGNISTGVASQVTKTPDGGFITCIGSNSTAGPIDTFCSVSYFRRVIFQKHNADASVQEWSKCYKNDGSDTAFIYIFPTNDSTYFLAGESNYGMQWLFHKEDAMGSIIWNKAYGGNSSHILKGMITTNDGGYIIVGEVYDIDTIFTTHYGNAMNTDIGVLKLDSLGNKVWSKVIGGTDDEQVGAVVQGPDNGCYIVGTTASDDYDCTGNHGDSSGSTDAYLVRLDANGNIMWHKDLGGTGYDQGNYGCTDGKGGIIIGATSGSNNGDVTNQINADGYNIWAINIDSNGNILWNNCYGGGGDEFTNSICKATDGSIWIACTNANRDSFEVDTFYGGNYDAWFVHADSIGNFLSAKVLGSHQQDEGFMVYPLSNGNVIAGGYYDTSGGSFPNIFYGAADAFLTVFTPSTTSVRELFSGHNTLELYPNPSNKIINIKLRQQRTSSCAVLICDMVGTQVYTNTISNQQSLRVQVSGWPAGVYIVQVIGEDGYKEVQKLIVE